MTTTDRANQLVDQINAFDEMERRCTEEGNEEGAIAAEQEYQRYKKELDAIADWTNIEFLQKRIERSVKPIPNLDWVQMGHS